MNNGKYREFVKSLSFGDQESLIQELIDQERISVHVAEWDETLDFTECYDNSSINRPNFESDCVLTILYIEERAGE